MTKICLFFAFFILSISIVPFRAFASQNSLRVYPAHIDISLNEKNEEKNFTFTIENNSGKTISIDLFAMDFNQKNELGIIGFLGREVKNYTYSLSSFIEFESPTLELAPKEKRNVVITVKNREDLSPGGHYAAVVIKERNSLQKVPTISQAMAVLVYLTKKGGERYNLSVKESNNINTVLFKYPSTSFITLQNDGNVHLVPYGTANIYDLFGRKIYKGVINEPSLKVLPQSIRRVPVYFKKVSYPMPISINTLKISGRDSLNKTKFTSEQVFIYVNPYIFFIVLIGAIIIFIKKFSKKND